MESNEEYDGFYFLPGDDDTELNIAYFNFEGEDKGEFTKESELGHTYHIAFFRKNSSGKPVYDEDFEAILLHPETYVKGLIGGNIFGVLMKKTTTTTEWFKDYLNTIRKKLIISDIVDNLKEIRDART